MEDIKEVMENAPYPHGEGDREHLDEMVPPRKEEKEKPGCNCHRVKCDMCNLYVW